MPWPPRWNTSQFKSSGVTAKVARAKRRNEHKAHELREKAKVRKRDKRCRFPLCGCKKLGLPLEVSHLQHKGMGGNPKGDRSVEQKMIYVCSARHRRNNYSIDRGTIEVRPLTDEGTNGPVAWWMDSGTDWYLLATEKPGGGYEPMNGWQSAQLRIMSEMNL